MALGVLSIIMYILAVIIYSIIFISIFKKENILKINWVWYCILFFVIMLTIISFTALPSNYIVYKAISIFFGLLGILGLCLNKFKDVNFKISMLLVSISLLGNFIVSFFI